MRKISSIIATWLFRSIRALNLQKKLILSCVVVLQIHANELENKFNEMTDKIPSTVRNSEENIVNSQDIQVREKDGVLQSNEQEVIDLFDKDSIEEKIDYSYCANYYRQASIYLGDGIYAIALKNGAIIGYSPTKPRSKRVQRYDKFSGLFLVGNSSTKMSYEISDIDEYALSKELASAGIKGAVPGKFQKHQSGFLQYAEFSAPTQRNGVISNICYKIYGLSVGGNGFIEKRYIERFLSQQTPYYGDLGVRFEVLDSESATFGVKFADPFFPNNPFKRGDILVSINDVAPKNWGDLELMVADLPFGEEAIVKIRRNEEEGIRTFRVKVGKRFGGMLLPDSFLERFNLIISNDFIVQKAPSSGPFSKLRKGDKILFINNIDMRQFHVKSTRERNQLLQELFTKIQSHQVDAIALLQDEEKRKQYAKIINKDILAQFQNKDVATRYDSFYRKMSENMEDFINPETSRKDKIPTSNAIDDIDLESFRGDEILRDSGTKSMRTIYDSYDIEGNLQPTNKKDTIKEYDMLTQHGLGMNFLIDRKGFQFRVPLE